MKVSARIFAGFVTLCAALTAAAGYSMIDGPLTLRHKRLDQSRSKDLEALANALYKYYVENRKVPDSLNQLIDDQKLATQISWLKTLKLHDDEDRSYSTALKTTVFTSCAHASSCLVIPASILTLLYSQSWGRRWRRKPDK